MRLLLQKRQILHFHIKKSQEHYAQLTEGNKPALDAVEDFQSCLTDLHDTLSDTLADLQGDIGTLTATLSTCLKILHKIQAEAVAN